MSTSAVSGPPLRLLSINVGGIQSDAVKRCAMFRLAAESGHHVILLQETHHSSAEQAGQWCRAGSGPGGRWVGKGFWSHGESNSRGLGILVSAPEELLSDFVVQHNSADGRLLRVDATYSGHTPVSFVNVYAPNIATERKQFFEQRLQAVLPADRTILMGGDFNCVTDALDISGSTGSSRLEGADELGCLEVAFSLVDAWRMMHPGEKDITHSSARHGSGARLDRWYVSASVSSWVQAAAIAPLMPGDHHSVLLRLAPPQVHRRGPGRFTLSLSLLHDADFCQQHTQLLQGFLSRHGLRLGYSRAARWDDLKRAAKDHAMDWGQRQARRGRQAMASLEAAMHQTRLAHVAAPADDGRRQAYMLAVEQLRTAQRQQAVDAAGRAALMWELHGERGTAWFHRLGMAHAPRADIHSLVHPDRPDRPVLLHTAAGRQLGEEVMLDFFSADRPEGLFQARATDAAAQRMLLAALDAKLAPAGVAAADSEATDGAMTVAELAAALQSMPNGRAPGPDGLPYEYFTAFWDVLGPELLAVANEAYMGAGGEGLPPSMCAGLIVLLHKGGGKPQDQLSSYRPLTLLNADCKVLSKVVTCRLAGPLDGVVDPTQTAFIPGRWIGANVLLHLEEEAYLTRAAQSGCVVHLDFEKAYDRMDRGWVLQVMEAMGFGNRVRRWVQLLQDGTCAAVQYNGWQTPRFPVRGGVPQGSPLSPLLYIIAAQPLAARLRQIQQAGLIRPILMPDGSPAPPSQQHADDTTLHVQSVADVLPALQLAVRPFCAASAAKLNVDKGVGRVLGSHAPVVGVHAASGIPFAAAGDTVRHLGVLLGSEAAQATSALFAKRVAALKAAIIRWQALPLTFVGRLHVAKQALASLLYYHATFIPPPADTLKLMERFICNYIQRPAQGDAAGLQRCMQHPSRAAAALPVKDGGMGMVALAVQIRANQAKVGALLLHPQRQPWKAFMRANLHDAAAGGLGGALLVHWPGRRPPNMLLRHYAYIAAMRATHPHRAADSQLHYHSVQREPLRHNAQLQPPLSAAHLAALKGLSIWRVGDLWAAVARAAPAVHHGRAMHAAWEVLPALWRALLLAGPQAEPAWHCTADGSLVTSQLGFAAARVYAVLADGRLRQVSGWTAVQHAQRQWLPCHVVDDACPQPVCAAQPGAGGDGVNGSGQAGLGGLGVGVGPGGLGGDGVGAAGLGAGVGLGGLGAGGVGLGGLGGGMGASAGSAAAPRSRLWLAGQWESLDLVVTGWAHGVRPFQRYTVRGAARRMVQLQYQASADGYVVGAGIQPCIWGSDAASVPLAIRIEEQRWGAGGAVPLEDPSLDEDVYVASWMRPSPARAAPLDRAQAARAPLPPLPRPLDEEDAVRSVPGPHLPWRVAWAQARWAALGHEQWAFAWRLLHGRLYVGAFLAHIDASFPRDEERCCQAACGDAGRVESLSHLFLECPAVQPVLQWLRRLWRCVAGEDVPLQAAVIIGGDGRAWEPGGGDAAVRLWHTLRLTVLHTIWCHRCQARLQGRAHHALGVISGVVHRLGVAMRLDWRRTRLTAQDTGQPVSAGPGRLGLTEAEFEARWALGGGLCSVSGPMGARLMVVHLSLGAPVAVRDVLG